MSAEECSNGTRMIECKRNVCTGEEAYPSGRLGRKAIEAEATPSETTRDPTFALSKTEARRNPAEEQCSSDCMILLSLLTCMVILPSARLLLPCLIQRHH